MSVNDLGPQPLDGLMVRFGISNADLVGASTKQLNFKMVARARKGRRLTPNVQYKVLEALTALKADEKFALKDLFNY
jgi:hypothetical protein